MFRDRIDAGRQLAERLSPWRGVSDAVVFGIPRGGVIVAGEVATALALPLDVVIAAKVGAPGNPEYAVGAVAQDGEVTIDPRSGYNASSVVAETEVALAKVHRYAELLRGEPRPPAVAGIRALLVDDGLATGMTARVSAEWLRRAGAIEVVVAAPVASHSAVRTLESLGFVVVTVDTPSGFYAVGQFYSSFPPTSDAEVLAVLAEHRV